MAVLASWCLGVLAVIHSRENNWPQKGTEGAKGLTTNGHECTLLPEGHHTFGWRVAGGGWSRKKHVVTASFVLRRENTPALHRNSVPSVQRDVPETRLLPLRLLVPLGDEAVEH